MVHYIIQTVAFQLFFLLVYDLFLKKETFFNWNRFYLLFTAVLSVVLPFIKIESLKNVVPPEYIITLPEVILGQPVSQENPVIQLDAIILNSSISYGAIIFYSGLILAAVVFLFKLGKILRLIFINPKTPYGKLTLIRLLHTNATFSFFRYVFLGELLKREDQEVVLKHEFVHANQWHSLDLLFFEILRILFWFNPLVYMYQNRITTLHEFIADAEAVKHENKLNYYQNLLAQVFETRNISFINPFFKQSLIKKRIIMLQKSKSKQIHLFKYALLIPMVLGMLVYSSCNTQEDKIQDNELSLVDRIHELKYAIETKGEITSEEEKQAMISLTETLNKTKYKNSGEVPFGVIDKVPSYADCESFSNNDDRKKCVGRYIAKHVNERFNTKLAETLGLTGKQRINVIFKINKQGDIIDVRSRAPHSELEAEAIRVIKTLPKMTPGEHNGKKVTVPYSLPIVFQVSE